MTGGRGGLNNRDLVVKDLVLSSSCFPPDIFILKYEAGGDIARQTGDTNITAGSEMSPVGHSDGNDSQDKAEDPHEDHGSTKCCLPLPTGGAAVSRPRGSWSAHPGGGGDGGGDGVPHSHILPHTNTARWSVWDRSNLKTAIWSTH